MNFAYFAGLPIDSNYLQQKRKNEPQIDHRGGKQVIQRIINARRDKSVNWASAEGGDDLAAVG